MECMLKVNVCSGVSFLGFGGWRRKSQNLNELCSFPECMSSELLEELMSSEGG